MRFIIEKGGCMKISNYTMSIIIIGIFVLGLTGCAKFEKDVTFNTDLNGAYTWSIGSEEYGYIEKSTYTFDEDEYVYTYYKNSNSEVIDNTSRGKVLSIEKISEDIDKIELQDDVGNENVLYVYKNLLGDFYNVKIPKDEMFDLIISTSTNSEIGKYPNEAIIFGKDGNMHSCLDYKNCTDTEDNHLGIYYRYMQKDGKIYFLSDSENNYYQILYYVTDEGLFIPSYTKEKK